jgi:hypothetical protein
MMRAWLKKYRTRAAVLFCCAFLPMLMAPSGGFPSRPRFQSVGVNAAAPAAGNITASGTVTAAGFVGNGSSVLTLASGGNITVAPTIGGSGICRADGTNCPAGVTTASGTFTATFTDACTADYARDVDWERVGNIVVMKFVSALTSCTSDSTGFATASGSVPAAIRPVGSSVQSPLFGNLQNNGATINGCVIVDANGTMSIGAIAGSPSCSAFNWTAAGAKVGPNSGMSFSFIITNP